MLTADIVSITMPDGKKTDSNNVVITFKGTSNDGKITSDSTKDRTGKLTDGEFGPDEWVGWSMSPCIDIKFEFSGVRKFKDVTLTVNVDKKRSYAVFKRSQIFFALTKDNFTSTVQYCLRNFTDNATQSYSTNITLSLCGNSAEFIKLRLYFGGRWLLISEIILIQVRGCTISVWLNTFVYFSILSFLLCRTL